MLAVALLLSSCGNGQSGPAAEIGNEIAPERIVSMTPALTEILFAIGAGDRVVGVTTYCDYPAEARTRPKIGGYANPSVEAIVALEPDLVLVSRAGGNREAALAVERVGSRVEVIPARTLDDTIEAIGQVATLCGLEDRGDDLQREIRGSIEATTARLRAGPKVRVLLCLQIDPLIAAGRGTLPSELVTIAGGVNVVEAGRYPRLGIEAVIAMEPQIILQAAMDTPEPDADRAALEFWSRWPSIPAVRDGRVHVIDGTTALRPGPRVADAVEMLARLLHPSRFPVGSDGWTSAETAGEGSASGEER
jgi:iron complex transport system substrate-binding protein